VIGDEAAAVVGSVTTISALPAVGALAVSEIKAVEISNGTTTNGTGLEIAAGVPGFCTSTMSVPDVDTSDGLSAVAHWPAVAQVVARGDLFNKIVDAAFPLPAIKFTPWITRGKPSTAPAITLEGRIVSMTGPLVIVTVAAADFVLSAWLVAVIIIALGDGADVGAV
jgi:hypothetical protein